jgi:hypothetical protein
MMGWDDDTGFLLGGLVPPAVVERCPVEAAFRAAVTYILHQAAGLHDGVCPHCGGTVETNVLTEDNALNLDVAVVYRCHRCEHRMTTAVGMVVLDHVEVVSFYRDHGIDLNERPAWTLPWIESDDHVAVESTDPFRISLSIPLDDERLELTFDDTVEVLEAERVAGMSASGDASTPADD